MASSVNFSGIGSNIDFNAIRDSILAERMRPVALLQARGSELTDRSSALKQLNGLLTNLTAASTALTDQTLGNNRTALSSDSKIIGASATSSASAATYDISVTRLATRLTQASQGIASTTDPILAGGATTATFELRLGGATTGTSITIDDTNNSLEGLRRAINSVDAGVTASIVDQTGDGTQNRLVLTSKATGTSGRVEFVETTSTGTGASLNLTSLNPPGAIGDFSALDAQFTINGLAVSRSSNSVADVIEGVSFDFKTTGSAKVEVTQSGEIADKLQSFIGAYNAVQGFLSAQYKVDEKGRPTGVLAGDPTLRTVQRQLREAINGVSAANGGSLRNLSDIGIGRDESGKLTLDTKVLTGKLHDAPADVRALLYGAAANKVGMFNTISANYSSLSDKVTGLVQAAIAGYESSIKSLSNSILDQTARISALKASLTRQFAAADAAIGQLNNQGSSLASIIASLTSSNNRK